MVSLSLTYFVMIFGASVMPREMNIFYSDRGSVKIRLT